MREDEEKTIGTEYEVWWYVYDWDDQSQDYYSIAKCKTEEEAYRIADKSVPPESYSSGTMVLKKLERKLSINNNR